jgi:hypothetical protein
MNPTRSVAPALVGGNLTRYRVYLLGQIIGATVAVAFEWILGRFPRTSDAAEGRDPTSDSSPITPPSVSRAPSRRIPCSTSESSSFGADDPHAQTRHEPCRDVIHSRRHGRREAALPMAS